MANDVPRMAHHRRSRRWLRALALLLVGLSIALVLSVDAAYDGLQEMLATAEPVISGHPVLGPLLFLVFSALSAMLAFFSSALLVPAAVYAWGQTATTVLLWLGWWLGGAITFALGRGLRGSAEGWPGGRFAAFLPDGRTELDLPLVLLWQLALPSEIPGYLSGYLGVPFRTYAAALALAELPYAVGAVWLGESVVNRKLGWLVGLVVVAATLGLLVARALRRRMPGPAAAASPEPSDGTSP